MNCDGLDHRGVGEHDGGTCQGDEPVAWSQQVARNIPGRLNDHRPDEQHGEGHPADEDHPARVVEIEAIEPDAGVLGEPTAHRQQRHPNQEAPRVWRPPGAHDDEKGHDGKGDELEDDHRFALLD